MSHYKPILYLLAPALFLGASCTQTATDTNTVSTTNENTNVAVTVNTNTDIDLSTEALAEVDTSDWLTYTNEEYGFSFRYPSDYTVEIVSPGYELRIMNNLGEPIKFYKQYYLEAATNDTLLFSKESLGELKEESEFRGKSNANNVLINSYYSYSIPGGNFYRGADFFLGQDYISMSLPFSTGSQIASNQTEEIDAFIKVLNAGEGLSGNEEQLAKVFDVIMNTISVN